MQFPGRDADDGRRDPPFKGDHAIVVIENDLGTELRSLTFYPPVLPVNTTTRPNVEVSQEAAAPSLLYPSDMSYIR